MDTAADRNGIALNGRVTWKQMGAVLAALAAFVAVAVSVHSTFVVPAIANEISESNSNKYVPRLEYEAHKTAMLRRVDHLDATLNRIDGKIDRLLERGQ